MSLNKAVTINNLILRAAYVARIAHAKYNGKPYITHPARVAGRTCVP